jgi:pyridinium-3,5-bisthiocarboxylic acid mononucleotide nickel chelatase
MKILYYDCFSGISGDMNLGAMIDLGVDPDFLKAELLKLSIGGYQIKISKTIKLGIQGTRVEVLLEAEVPFKHETKKIPKHHFKLATGEQSSKNTFLQTEHNQRDYKIIKSFIENSQLNSNVKQLSLAIFHKVAEAEGKIHGIPLEDVHFHEVGAIDSIVDIVGAAICIDFLKPDKIIASPPQLGGGFVKCAHGIFPVPAPATAEILKGIPTRFGAVNAETTTPTGAAILATVCHKFTEHPEFTILKIGYGIGFKDFKIPNVLRVILAEDNKESEDWLSEESSLIVCNIDDMSSERFEFVMEKLFALGADDVFFEPIYMKKNRPAHMMSVLISPTLQDNALQIIFTETTTLGVRIMHCQKKMMHRHSEIIQTQWGPVSIKYGLFQGKKIKCKPEYTDCSKIARENNLSFSFVYNNILKQIQLD